MVNRFIINSSILISIDYLKWWAWCLWLSENIGQLRCERIDSSLWHVNSVWCWCECRDLLVFCFFWWQRSVKEFRVRFSSVLKRRLPFQFVVFFGRFFDSFGHSLQCNLLQRLGAERVHRKCTFRRWLEDFRCWNATLISWIQCGKWLLFLPFVSLKPFISNESFEVGDEVAVHESWSGRSSCNYIDIFYYITEIRSCHQCLSLEEALRIHCSKKWVFTFIFSTF